MKIYIFAVLIIFSSSYSFACLEDKVEKENNFIKYDVNNDGYIDKEELHNINKEKLDKVFQYSDNDKDEKLSKAEFLEISLSGKRC